jgi:hypothetical protein
MNSRRRVNSAVGFLMLGEKMKRVVTLVVFILLAMSLTISVPANAQRFISSSGTFSGKVFRSDTNVAMSNSYILLMQEKEKPVEAQHFDTRTDADGRYRFTDIPAGKYTVSIYSWYPNRTDVPCADSAGRKTVDEGHVTVEWQRKSDAFMEIVTIKGFVINGDHNRSKDFDVACR